MIDDNLLAWRVKMNSKRFGALVMKFGGTSVGDVEAIRQSSDIVFQSKAEWKNLIVIVSAMAGVTDLLIKTATESVNGNPGMVDESIGLLRNKHFFVLDELIAEEKKRAIVKSEIITLLDYFKNLCHAIRILGEATPRAWDTIAGIGERLCVRVFSAVLNEIGLQAAFVEATDLIVTDNVHQAALPDMDKTEIKSKKVLIPFLEKNIVPVVTGFIAATADGIATTLGRGGSDFTASILGVVLNADDVWIWTDVDGVMSADPRLVSNARTIPELSYREIAELAYYGAKVVHPKTMRPVIDAGIGIRVCNTFNPSHPGTRLIPDLQNGKNGKIKAVTAIHNQSLITIEGRGMLGVPGVAARTFGAVAATGTSVPLITQASSEQSICFAVPVNVKEIVLEALENEFVNEIRRRDIDKVWATSEVVIVTLVGAGMRYTPGIAGSIFGNLGFHNVNVIAIAQGSSEVSISLVVNVCDAEKAVKSLHELING